MVLITQLGSQLTSPELNYSIVRPLTKKLSKHNDGSMIYVLMVNR